MLTIASILLFVIVLHLNLNRDVSRGRRNRTINHNNRSWVRAGCLSPAIIWLAIAINPHFTWHVLWQLALSGSIIGLAWLNMFNGLFNIRRKEKWFFPGSDGPEDGIIENFIQENRWVPFVAIALNTILIIGYIFVRIHFKNGFLISSWFW